jgi:hypothetical protein
MSMLDAALALSQGEDGWAIIPCRESGDRAKAPYTEHGSKEATRGEHIIREWWERWPNALIGGKVPKSAIVFDIDPKNEGSLDELVAVTGPLPPTLSVWSGRNDGGIHMYFQRPPDMEYLVGKRLPPGIDLLVNGYAIMPPSLHPVTGEPYIWMPGEMAVLPKPVVKLLTPEPRMPRPVSMRGNVEGLANKVAYADPGNRNELLFWAARTAHEEGASEEAFEKLASAGLHAGLTETEVRRTIASGRHQTGDLSDT